MDQKIKNILDNFLKDKEFNTEEELNQALERFINSYHQDKLEDLYQETDLDKAYDLLEQAQNTKSKTKAQTLAKQAYDNCEECFDAYLYYVELEKNLLKKQQLLEEGLQKEKTRLIKENFFTKDYIGAFYGVYETRPYIRGLYLQALLYTTDGKMHLAQNTCQEILKLNESDNTGSRFLLMAIYAHLEKEKELLDLTKKYDYECLESLIPLMTLYYKQNNYPKAKEYLNKINQCNPNFKKYYKEENLEDDNYIDGYYQRGSASEVIMYQNNYSFLLDNVYTIDEFILKDGNI